MILILWRYFECHKVRLLFTQPLWWRSYGIVVYHTRIKTRQCKVCYLICSAFVKTILFFFFDLLFKTCSIAVFLFSKVLPKISSPTRPQPHFYFEIIKTIICPRPIGGSTLWPDIVCGLPTRKIQLIYYHIKNCTVITTVLKVASYSTTLGKTKVFRFITVAWGFFP